MNDWYVLDIAKMEWFEPQIQGDVMQPLLFHSATNINGTIWMIGGIRDNNRDASIYAVDTKVRFFSSAFFFSSSNLRSDRARTALYILVSESIKPSIHQSINQSMRHPLLYLGFLLYLDIYRCWSRLGVRPRRCGKPEEY
jgi:hypothetical protein